MSKLQPLHEHGERRVFPPESTPQRRLQRAAPARRRKELPAIQHAFLAASVAPEQVESPLVTRLLVALAKAVGATLPR
jgi:hypothetical protein